jgi:hypothetical protein
LAPSSAAGKLILALVVLAVLWLVLAAAGCGSSDIGPA